MARATARYVRRRTQRLRTRLGVFGLVALVAAIAVGVVWAASVDPTHIGGANNVGKSCAENFPGTTELKLNQGTSGTVTLGAFSVTATIPSSVVGAPAASLDFTANSATIVIGVIVKDGVDGANKYDYRPDGVQSDTNLTTPGPPNGTFKGISHINFCVVANEGSPDPLDVEKTAAGSYDRDITWTLDKSVDPDSHSGKPGDTFDSDWTVEVKKNVDENDFLVSGQITVSNTNDFDIPFSLTDELDNGDDATIVCPGTGDATGEVPANDSVTCDYSVAQTDASAVENTAEVIPGNPDVGGDSDTASIDWKANVTGDEEVDLADDRGPLAKHLSDSDTSTYNEKFECSSNPEDYTNGVDIDTYPNTATLKGDNTDLEDKAEVTVRCTLDALKVAKTADATLDRTYTWTIDKELVDANANPVKYKVTVTPDSGTDSNWKVTGSITIDNPASIAQTFSVDDLLDDGTVGTVSCPSNTVAAGGQVVCTYSASPADGSATENEATVKAAGNADQVATAPVSFTPNLIDECTNVYDDNGTPGNTADDKFLGKVCIDSATKYFEYTIDFGLSDGQCKTITNTASSITEDTKTKATDSVTVRLCEPATPGYWKNHLAKTGANIPGFSSNCKSSDGCSSNGPFVYDLLPQTLGTYVIPKTGAGLTTVKGIYERMNCSTSGNQATQNQNAIGCLAGHLLSAKLNRANDSPGCIDATIAKADSFLSGGTVDGVTGVNYTPTGSFTTISAAQRAKAIELKNILDTYNNGGGCP